MLLLDKYMRAPIPGASTTETPHPTRVVFHDEAPSQIMDLRHVYVTLASQQGLFFYNGSVGI